jgi:hypothetical protein
MKYEPRKEFDWLLFIFFLTSFTKGVLGFWGNVGDPLMKAEAMALQMRQSKKAALLSKKRE